MQWEALTAANFKKAAKKTGVCILAPGVLEKHSEHLPLGTDFVNIHKIACLAAEQEPAVVFPPFYFGQIYEARCYPGTVTIKPTLLLELWQAVLDEIGRNGFRKIVIYNGHGGNDHFLSFLAQCQLWKEKPYSLYLPPLLPLTPARQRQREAMLKTTNHGHACECETSMTLANCPEWVRLDQLPRRPAGPLGRLKHLPPTYSGFSWYSDYPTHYAGDGRAGTRDKGLKLRALLVDTLAEYVAAVKKDQVLPALQNEFYARTRKEVSAP